MNCPDHPDVRLTRPKVGYHLECLACSPGSSWTGDRRCSICLAPDASWMSGLCSGCYDRTERERAESQRDSRRASTERWVLEDARQRALAGTDALRVLDEMIEARS